MVENPFADFRLDIPNKYADAVRNYSQTGGEEKTVEMAPFRRQVDFWYTAFLIGVKQELSPEPEKDNYNATPGTIFSSDPSRILHMQIAYLGHEGNMDCLASPRKVFDFCLGVANAGMPVLINVLSDPDDKPLWALYDKMYELAQD